MRDAIDGREWVVQRIRHDRRRLTVPSEPSAAPAPWLARLRRLLPERVSQAPAELLTQLRQTGRIDLGIVTSRAAHRMGSILLSNGFEVTVEDASEVVLFPIHRTHGDATVIRDEAARNAFCELLIANGSLVEEVET